MGEPKRTSTLPLLNSGKPVGEPIFSISSLTGTTGMPDSKRYKTGTASEGQHWTTYSQLTLPGI